jgi:hypothetical protein
MITKETAVKIWNCYNEIESAETIIKDLAESSKKSPDEAPSLRNAFGERCGLQLGVPSGSNGHQLFGVNLELSIKIVQKHIEEKEQKLQELKAIATLELKAG